MYLTGEGFQVQWFCKDVLRALVVKTKCNLIRSEPQEEKDLKKKNFHTGEND
jgi:hypothetical protein